MTRRIEDEVRQNRRTNRRVSSFFREPTPSQTTNLRFADVEVFVEVTASIYTRPLNDTLVTGHPDAKQGFGRGTFGDNRGSWTQVATESDAELVKNGRNAIANAMSGAAEGIEQCQVGSGTSTPASSDASLDSGAGLADAFGVKNSGADVTGVGILRFAEATDTVSEFGLHAQDDDLICRGTLTTVDPAVDEEVKIEVTLTFTEDTTGSAAVTSLVTFADSIASEAEAFGLKEMAFGTDGTNPTTSDSSLGSEVIRKEVGHNVGESTIRATTTIFKDEPGTQPHDIREVAIFDQDGTMLWRLTFSAEEKDEEITMKGTTGVEVI